MDDIQQTVAGQTPTNRSCLPTQQPSSGASEMRSLHEAIQKLLVDSAEERRECRSAVASTLSQVDAASTRAEQLEVAANRAQKAAEDASAEVLRVRQEAEAAAAQA